MKKSFAALLLIFLLPSAQALELALIGSESKNDMFDALVKQWQCTVKQTSSLDEAKPVIAKAASKKKKRVVKNEFTVMDSEAKKRIKESIDEMNGILPPVEPAPVEETPPAPPEPVYLFNRASCTLEKQDLTMTVTLTSEDPLIIADQLRHADIALLVTDFTQGIVPQVREQLLIARQTYIPHLAVFYTRTEALRATPPKAAFRQKQDEEIRMREFLRYWKMKDGRATILFDNNASAVSLSPIGKGIDGLKTLLKTEKSRRTEKTLPAFTHEFSSYYQLVGYGEVTTSPPALANGDTLTVWANGFSATGKIRNKAKESHDGNGEFTLVLETPIPVAAKSRTFFVQNDRVIGIGIAKDILR